MPKRPPLEDQDRSFKRQKVDPKGIARGPRIPPEKITSSAQLSKLLTFQQDDVSRSRHGIQSLKVFLDSILYPPKTNAAPNDDHGIPGKKKILADFLAFEGNKVAKEDPDRITFLENLFKTIACASENRWDDVFAAGIAVVALLLKTIASDLQLEQYGQLLCKIVLRRDVLQLVQRGLSLPKKQEFIVSPCLRLLTEVVSCGNEGISARFYKMKDYAFEVNVISRILAMRPDEKSRLEDKPSLRSNAVKFLLANLKYQTLGAKIDILRQRNLFTALFDNLAYDSLAMVAEVLNVVKQHVFQDTGVSKELKQSTLTQNALANILRIAKTAPTEIDEEARKTVPLGAKPTGLIARNFLQDVCTNPRLGLSRRYAGWYPPDTLRPSEKDEKVVKEGAFAPIDMGLDSVGWYNDYQDSVHVRNGPLSIFLQTLRPWANEYERELLLAVFRTHPELVADYFFKKTGFGFAPKLTSTWIGFSTVLFETVQLSPPRYFGAAKDSWGDVPPPVSIAIESILPGPLGQNRALARSLLSDSELISFFAIRILIVGLVKLRKVLQLFDEAGSSKRRSTSSGGKASRLWQEGSDRLAKEFRLRAPTMKEVLTACRRIDASKPLQREAVTRLLRLYYEVLPKVALAEKFDLSMPLTTALASFESADGSEDNMSDWSGRTDTETRQLEKMTLEHLLVATQYAFGMQWFKKPGAPGLSPFAMLFRIESRGQSNSTNADRQRDGAQKSDDIRSLLKRLLTNKFILQNETPTSPFVPLIAGLKLFPENMDELLAFLDECCARVVQKPIKYEDDLEELRLEESGRDPKGETSSVKPVSNFVLAVLAQYEFIIKMQSERAKDITRWVLSLLQLLRHIGEDKVILARIKDLLSETAVSTSNLDGHSLKEIIEEDVDLDEEQIEKILQQETEREARDAELAKQPTKPLAADGQGPKPVDYEAIFKSMQPDSGEKTSYGILAKTTPADFDGVIEDGPLEEIIKCLYAPEKAIRKQAVAKLYNLNDQIRDSTHPDAYQISLLLNEILNTIARRPSDYSIDKIPLPHVVTAFAISALKVLTDPMHPMYPKLNDYLTRRPVWAVSRILSYWSDKIIAEEPADDGTERAVYGRDMGDDILVSTNGRQTELLWLLDMLFQSIQSSADAEIFRKCGTWEKLLALWTGPDSSVGPVNTSEYGFGRLTAVREAIVKILVRASWVKGAQATLAARFGVLAWLEERIAERDLEEGLVRKMGREFWKRCGGGQGEGRMEVWEGAMKRLIGE
ncbi:hypothetical protein K402DRAFT_460209 [Aulographum hederae CBS 113979]|uniref:Ribosome biogenesis protein Urb1 n=1 Tax=Aulographum hederae CBS 113979 TaxID=1176131 RepID=A0A6G1HCZ1_9PEZI|nr:hypothetical protein K402DRAFT_460209 [Aulographum hederae CBS 113979]